MAVYAISFIEGLGLGSAYYGPRKGEIEAKQGAADYFVAPLLQARQITPIVVLAQKFIPFIPMAPLRMAAGWTLTAATIPLYLFPIFMNLAKNRVFPNRCYPHAQTLLHQKIATLQAIEQNYFFSYPILQRILRSCPSSFSERTVKIFDVTERHFGEIVRTTLLVGSVAMAALNQKIYAAGTLSVVAFGYLEQHGYVSTKVSLLMETYMPVLSLCAQLLSGTWLLQLNALLQIICYIPTCQRWIQGHFDRWLLQRIDWMIEKFQAERFIADETILRRITVWQMRSQEIRGTATIADIDTPLRPQNLTFAQMKSILGGTAAIKFDPIHCSKLTMKEASLQQEWSFQAFQALFDGFDCDKNYPIIRKKCLDDGRFREYLAACLADESVTQKVVETNPQRYLAQALDKLHKGEKEFVLAWFREQMQAFVEILTDKKPVTGRQADLVDAKLWCSYILPYLKTLRSGVEYDDILLKLAVEGGDYCALGIKRASSEIVQGVTSKGLSPIEQTRVQTFRALENLRNRCFQSGFKILRETMVAFYGISDKATEDVHFIDMYRKALTLGFYPLTPSERYEVDVTDIFMLNFYKVLLVSPAIYSRYNEEMDSEIKATIDYNNIYRYILDQFTNSQFSAEQKRELQDDLDDFDIPIENKRNLFYVMLGIQRLSAV